ncbi:C39 family peptidase [Clostridium sp.]|uniref:C39 family peptidase n=1 Tax=Clostridium sp. TaxID=1506 RepID=UPI0026258B76|nr:C39 family peptidase [Clostridium sp.]
MYNIEGGVQTLPKFNGMIGEYAFTHGYAYGYNSQSYYLNNSSNLTSLTSFIKTQINNNNPVAMLIGGNTPTSTYKTDFATHWVTITGYNFNNGYTNVTVSSWGGRYTLSLAELLANRLWIDVDYLYCH